MAAAFSPAEYGLVGAIAVPTILTIVGTFVWWVRVTRADIKEDRRAFREDITKAHSEARADVAIAHADFNTYLQDTSAKQIEVLVSVGSALQANTQAMLLGEKRSEERHEATMTRFRGLEEMLSDEMRRK